MIDTSNWKPFFKYGDDGSLCLAQQTYEPLISPDRTMFCANYDWQNKYQRTYEDRELYTAEVCDWFFQNELYHLTKFKGKSYAPNIIVHETARFRLDETGGPVNNLFNLETMFKRSLSTHVLWRDKNMYYIYKEIFTNE